ncbi:hypothetical protein IKR55_02125 [bacterium]|nr:hypothetical protein [bacterium]
MIILEAILGFFILDEVCKIFNDVYDDQDRLEDEIYRLKRELAVARKRV